jgi:hypothetical protein
MNEERTGKCLRQVEHICCHLRLRYSIAVNQVMLATVQLSKWNICQNLLRIVLVKILWFQPVKETNFIIRIIMNRSKQDCVIDGWFGWVMKFQQHFSYIMAVSFIG